MVNHLDFTIDFETCSLSANAAVMQVAVVPWNRYGVDTPFFDQDRTVVPYVGYVDLRTCVVDGFDFDTDTISWWSRQSKAAKEALVEGFAEPMEDVLAHVMEYICEAMKAQQAFSVCLWSQGTDVDIAILRNLCRKYSVDLEKEIPHTCFRDCRTVILEAAVIEAVRSLHGKTSRACGLALPEAILSDPSKAYALYDELPEVYSSGREAHDAHYDALRSSWLTWQALKLLRKE